MNKDEFFTDFVTPAGINNGRQKEKIKQRKDLAKYIEECLVALEYDKNRGISIVIPNTYYESVMHEAMDELDKRNFDAVLTKHEYIDKYKVQSLRYVMSVRWNC